MRVGFQAVQQSNSRICSSLLGLGGTHVQQSFRSRRNICAAVFCVPFPPIFMCRIFLCIQKQFNMSLLSYMSYQHHVGLQPANIVTLLTPFVFPSTVDNLFRFQRSLRITFRESIFFLPVPHSATSRPTVQDTFIDLHADGVPYEIITYVLDPR